MLNLRKKTAIIFCKICAIGLFFLISFLFLNVLLYNRLSLLLTSLGGKLEAVCGCINYLSFSDHPIIFSSLILTGLGIVFFFCFALFKILKLRRVTNKFIKVNLNNKKDVLSKKLKEVVNSLNLEKKVIEVDDNNPLVFCFGLIRPKICISSTLVRGLDKKELKAVLLHEQYHLITYETIKLFIVKTIAAILFFVPGLKSLVQRYFIFLELAADKWSIDNSKNKIPLAGAIYKVLELKENIVLRDSLTVPSFNHITEERIKRMVDNNYNLNIKVFKPQSLIHIFLLASFVLSFIFFVHSSKSVIASHSDDFCSSEQTNNEQCRMLSDGSMCEMYHQNVLPKNAVCSESF